ncbi:hypothetical protein GCM10009642_48010 [Nocardiopsis metallicus]
MRGDATGPRASGPKNIAHVCNNRGGWGKPFVLALSGRWSGPERDYRTWRSGRSGNDFALGAVRLIRVRPGVHVANMVALDGVGHGSGPPIRYEALATCRGHLADQALGLGRRYTCPGSAAASRAASGAACSR